jgi:hypothetical protein
MGETNQHQTEEDEEREFWLAASRPSMDAIWGNEEDDVNEQLLKTGRPVDLDTKDSRTFE